MNGTDQSRNLVKRGLRQIDHTVYEPGSFTPLVRLSTTAKGGRQQKNHLAVQAIRTALSGQAEQELATMQGMISAMSESEQKLMEQTLRQVMEQGLPQQALDMLGEEMAQHTTQLLKNMGTSLQEQQKQERQDNPIAIHYYHCNHLGTPIALTDQQGQIVWAAKYDPWGNIEKEFNPNNINQDIRLPGQHHDQETGLYHNRHRYYDPKLGSYINQDPIGLKGGMNIYGYVLNDPVNLVDWNGASPEDVNKILDQYRKTVQQMKDEGKRLRGDGWFTGIVNNSYRNYFYITMYNCADQSRRVLLDLKDLKLDDSWKFNLIGGPPHCRAQAVPMNGSYPLITMDPWANDIIIIQGPPFTPDSRINPYLPYQ